MTAGLNKELHATLFPLFSFLSFSHSPFYSDFSYSPNNLHFRILTDQLRTPFSRLRCVIRAQSSSTTFIPRGQRDAENRNRESPLSIYQLTYGDLETKAMSQAALGADGWCIQKTVVDDGGRGGARRKFRALSDGASPSISRPLLFLLSICTLSELGAR